MEEYFSKVKNYLLDLNVSIESENEEEGILIIKHEESGISNLILSCQPPILVMEQLIFETTEGNTTIYKELLMKNREIIHGAFVLDESGKKVLFRDTLELDTLDIEELEGSINSLTMLLGEYSDQIISFSKN